tara:strand:+ start:143 stop:412 length:270 start_codon:yes stop_codon:yes gene_type:complete
MYAFPYIGNIKIGEIRHPDIVRLLEPIWLTKAETAKRTRKRIESVFDFAAAHGIFDRANPANIALSPTSEVYWTDDLSLRLEISGNFRP